MIMHKLDVKNAENTSVGAVELPGQFQEAVRPDLIKRAVEAMQSHGRQPYGAFPRAGKQHAAKLSRRRRDYKASYGIGISRVPRKILTKRGSRFNWVGAFAPGTVGGRRAHPPKADKIWDRKINVQERRKAIRSALSATISKALVEQRGHRVPPHYPFILDSGAEQLRKTKEVRAVLAKLGLGEELARVQYARIIAGRGKMRGRRHHEKRGPLLVVSGACPLAQSARNIAGVEVCAVDHVNAELLAPGADPGRLTLFTKAAIERLAKEQLFTPAYRGPSGQKTSPAEKPAAPVPRAVKAAKPAKATKSAAHKEKTVK